MNIKEKIKHKYALSEQGAQDMIKAIAAVTVSNIVLMFPVGLLYLLASDILNGAVSTSRLPWYIIGIIVSLTLIVLTTYRQYNAAFPLWKKRSC